MAAWFSSTKSWQRSKCGSEFNFEPPASRLLRQHNFTRHGPPRRGDYRITSRIGFDYIELSLSDMAALPKSEFDFVRQRVERSGILCEACNNFFPPGVRLTGKDARRNPALDYARAALELAASLEARMIVFGSAGAKNVPPGFPKDVAWKQIVKLLQQLGPMAAQYGITIAIEPLNRQESNIVNLVSEALALAREVDHPNVQLLIDYYHLVMESEDPEIILTAGPAIRHVHFAQVAGRVFPTGANEHYSRFFDRLRQAGYAGRYAALKLIRVISTRMPRTFELISNLTNRKQLCQTI